MDPNSGRIYRGNDIARAQAAGIPLVNVSERVAAIMELGQQVQAAIDAAPPEEREACSRQVRRYLERKAAKVARRP